MAERESISRKPGTVKTKTAKNKQSSSKRTQTEDTILYLQRVIGNNATRKLLNYSDSQNGANINWMDETCLPEQCEEQSVCQEGSDIFGSWVPPGGKEQPGGHEQPVGDRQFGMPDLIPDEIVERIRMLFRITNASNETAAGCLLAIAANCSNAFKAIDTITFLWGLYNELDSYGLYGPKMEEAIACGYLPPAPEDYVQQKVFQIRWFILYDRFYQAFYHINGMDMTDMVDLLRLLSIYETAILWDHIDSEGDSFGPQSAARMRMAFRAVREGKFEPDSLVPEDQQETVRGYTRLRLWLYDLPIADRPKGKNITYTGGSLKGGAKPLNMPDIGRSTDMLSTEQTAIVELIKRNRERLPSRLTDANISNGGYSYNGIDGPKPSTLSQSSEIDKELYKELGSEGKASAIQTYDRAILTLGSGLAHQANGGTLESFIMKLFKKDPEFKTALLNAGITYDEQPDNPYVMDWFVVNTDIGVVEKGSNALQLIRFDRQLLSLFINLSESEEHRQNVADAQWEALKEHRAFNVPPWAKSWNVKTIRLCAHCVFWGAKADWPIFEKCGGNWHQAFVIMVKHLIDKTGYTYEDPDSGARVVKQTAGDGCSPSVTMLGFVDKYAIRGKIVKSVEAPSNSNNYYFDMSDSKTYKKGYYELVP